MKKTLALLSLLAVVTGCANTAIGPVVTNVMLDGNGNLIVEKSMLEKSVWDGSVVFGLVPTTQVLRLPTTPAEKR